MVKQQSAGSGRSTPNRKSMRAKTQRKTDTKDSLARQQKKRTKNATATSKSATKKPRVRKRPSITRKKSIWQHLGHKLVTISKALRDPASWQRTAQKLPPWADELGAILLIVLGVVMLTALLNTTSEALLSVTLSHYLRLLFGYGAYLVPLAVLGTGIIILLPKFGIFVRIGWVCILAIEIAFSALTALFHLFANDPESHALAREGGGGGYLGWALMQLTDSLGHILSILFFALVFTISLFKASGLHIYHLTLGITRFREQLQRSIHHLDAVAFEPGYDDDYNSEDAIYYPSDSHNDPLLPGSNQNSTMPHHRPSIVPRENTSEAAAPAPLSAPPPPNKSSRPRKKTSSPKAALATNPEEASPNKNTGSEKKSRHNPDRSNGNSRSKRPKPQVLAKPLTQEEKRELVDETRRTLGAANGRSLIAPGEPGERPSIVPREFLPDARVVPATPRARIHRKPGDPMERHFTVDDFREVKKSGKRHKHLPSLDLLSDIELNKPTEEEINTNARIIKNTLLEFDVETEVIDVKIGPTVTQYAVSPYTEQVNVDGDTILNRVRVSEITNLNGDLALALSAKRLRIQAPVPGHSYVGIEVPNRQPSTVALRPVLESEHFYKYRNHTLVLPLGRDVSGEPFITDLATMPHLLIAGTTGSGKSIMLAAMTTSIVMNNLPDQVKLVLLDPKMVELSRFNGLPHLLGPVETELDRIIGVLRWATREMDRRYKLLEKAAARNLEVFNKSLGRRRRDERLPYIVIIIDEIGDLMMMRPDETERTLTRLAQMARAVGMHLMVATQRPSVDVITGLIKANFPARISFAVASGIDSRVILDSTGAEMLMGKGDMLFLAPDAAGPQRVQGCYISDDEVDDVVTYWKTWTAQQDGGEQATSTPVAPWERGMTRREVLAETDSMLEDAIALVIAEGEASASMIQRRLGLGYPRAARIMDLLHELGIVGAARPGGRTREVLVKPGADPFRKIVDKRIKNKK